MTVSILEKRRLVPRKSEKQSKNLHMTTQILKFEGLGFEKAIRGFFRGIRISKLISRFSCFSQECQNFV